MLQRAPTARPRIGVEALNQALLAADSATAVLERLLGTPIAIRRIETPTLPPTAEQRARLRLGDATPWAHRRVVLLAAGQSVSEADLWYVPSRLTVAMVQALQTTDAPFGRIVRSLNPKRTTLSAETAPGDSPNALQHRALLTAAGHPIAEVHERYSGEAFGTS